MNEYIENIRKAHEQKIDMQNPDTVTAVDWDRDNKTKAETSRRIEVHGRTDAMAADD